MISLLPKKINGYGNCPIKINALFPILILFLCSFSFVGHSYSQHVLTKQASLSLQDTQLSDALSEISKSYGVKLVYTGNLVNQQGTVSLHASNEKLEQVLDKVLTPRNLAYSVIDESIVLKTAPKPVQATASASKKPPVTITGKVTDKKGETLPGVTVLLKGTQLGASTDGNGIFALNIPSNEGTLIFTYLGFKTQEVKIDGRTTFNIVLAEASSQLSEVVVSGYTTQNRAEFTGSSAHVSGEAIASRPVPSFDQALAGQAAGVNVTSNGGALNAAPVFRIRGFNSIELSSSPLIIIDGITAFTGNVGGTAQNNPLADINPNDIESIEILKDASATAIYGSRAANGVVVITTKKGSKGAAKVSYDTWVGINTAPRLMDVLGAEDYVMIKNEARVNAGLAPAFFLQEKPEGGHVETNWYDYVYQTGFSQNHNLSVSGASDATSYFVSLGYSDQEGFMVKNTFNRKSARLNLNHKVSDRFTIGTNMTYSNSLNSNLTSGTNAAFSLNNLARMSMVLPPNLSPYNEDGTYNIVGNSIGYGANTILTGYYNMMPLVEHDRFTSESNTFLGSVYGEFEILKGLRLKTNYSMNSLIAENKTFNNPYQAGGFSNNGSANNSLNKNRRTNWTNTLNYNTTIAGDHGLNLMVGTEDIHTTTNGWGVTRQNLNDRFFDDFEGSWGTVRNSSGSLGENGFRSYFTSLNYDYKKKYLLSGSFRRDGFSGLAEGYKYGNFGGGSIGWNISEEDFFQSSAIALVVSGLKVRASYGQVGNVNIGDWPALSLYSSGSYAGLATTLAPTQAGNPDLRWETSKKSDIGLNIGLFNNRITLDADYYNNNIDGMILDARQAPSKGIPGNSITSNIGSMYNRGFEFDINAHIIENPNFKWTANFNFSTLKNEVTSLANNNADIWNSGLETSNIVRVGESLGAIYVVKTGGVNPENGLRTYINRNGEQVQYNPVGSKWTYLDGTTAPALDAYADGYVVGNAIPSYYGGFNHNFSYKNIDLSLNFTYSGGNYMYNGTRATLLDNRFFNNSTEILNRWTTPGQVTDIPKLHYNDQYASGSVLMHSGNVEDGSFVKLRNVSMGYRVPDRIFSKIGLSSVRIYGSATNFLLYTKYTGSDPEISANGDSNTQQGRDKNAVPAGKSFTLGLNIAL